MSSLRLQGSSSTISDHLSWLAILVWSQPTRVVQGSLFDHGNRLPWQPDRIQEAQNPMYLPREIFEKWHQSWACLGRILEIFFFEYRQDAAIMICTVLSYPNWSRSSDLSLDLWSSTLSQSSHSRCDSSQSQSRHSAQSAIRDSRWRDLLSFSLRYTEADARSSDEPTFFLLWAWLGGATCSSQCVHRVHVLLWIARLLISRAVEPWARFVAKRNNPVCWKLGTVNWPER